jgi:hypothetical protein
MDDPIFAAIEEYKRTDKACYDTMMDYESGPKTWWEAHPEIDHAYKVAIDVLAETRPTTVAGAATLVALIGEEISNGQPMDWHAPALTGLAEALGGMTRDVTHCHEGR